jgi:hypothetical protein
MDRYHASRTVDEMQEVCDFFKEFPYSHTQNGFETSEVGIHKVDSR